MRIPVVAGNWKMHKSFEEGLSLASEVIPMVQDEMHHKAEIVLCVPYIHLAAIARLADGTKTKVGAQDCSTETQGAYTGQVSAGQILSTGAKYVIIGHSERRQYNHETASQLTLKVKQALSAGLTPIFCCGEPLEIRQSGNFLDFVAQQLTDSLFELTPADFEKLIIAYEPIWAIGTGLNASNDQAQEMHAHLRNHLKSKFGNLADGMRILYGGSVKASNAAELFACPDVDGGLVGGASLASREFTDIVKCAQG